MTRALIGLGSNCGDRGDNIRREVEALDTEDGAIKVLRVSAIYESLPWGVTDQPNFFNGVAEVETRLTPHGLLARLKDIEKELGRRPTRRWADRLVDLDILLFGELVIDEIDLKVPHPYIAERDFVLHPLRELVPEMVHPKLGVAIKDIEGAFDEGNLTEVDVF